MSILSFSNLSYSYDKKKNIFSNISAEMELGKYMRFQDRLVVAKQHYFLCWVDQIVLPKARYYLMERILRKRIRKSSSESCFLYFQAYNLIDYMTPLENVKLTSKLLPEPVQKNGIDERGNETECVTTFRRSTTTCSDCKDIGFKSTRYFTDEPTGNLDEETAQCSLCKYWKIVYTR